MSDDKAPGLYTAFGLPRLAGGAPETDEPEDQPTPEPEAPETDQPTEFDASTLPQEAQDYISRREKEMTGDYTRKTQELATQREALQEQARAQAQQIALAARIASDPDHPQYEQARQLLGIEDEVEYEDEEDEYLARLEAVEQRLNQGEEARQAQAIEDADWDHVGEAAEEIQRRLGREIEDDELWMVVDAIDRTRDDDDRPNAERAYELLTGTNKVLQKHYVSTKKGPRTPGGGTPGSRKLDLSTREDRLAAAAEVAEAAMHAD